MLILICKGEDYMASLTINVDSKIKEEASAILKGLDLNRDGAIITIEFRTHVYKN